MLKNAADVVMFVWREQDEEGEPQEAAELYVRKARDARLGTMRAQFDGMHQRFLAEAES